MRFIVIVRNADGADVTRRDYGTDRVAAFAYRDWMQSLGYWAAVRPV